MADNEVSTTKQPQTVQSILANEAFQTQIARALPSHMTGDRMLRVAATAVRKNPRLGQCTPGSFAACMLTLSAAGLEPDGRRAHLIPYKDECTVILDYKGLVELALRNGDIATIHADVVCDRDEFEFDLGQVTRHRVNLRESRGEPYAAYALVRKKDGSTQAAVMSRDEIEAVRKRSRSGQSGPWTTDWGEMAKKTVFRRLSKWLVLSPEIRDLVEAEDGEYQQPQPATVQGKGMAKLAGLMQQPAVEEPAFVDVTEEVTGGS
jgi:recombination protein RecT